MSEANDSPVKQSAAPLRRLGAIFYDALLLIAVLFVVTALFMPLTQGKAPSEAPFPLSLLYRLTLLVAWFGFFVIFWLHGGQTLGMKVWRIAIVRSDGAALTWLDAIKRVALAILPLLPALVTLGFGGAITSHALTVVGLVLLVLAPLNYATAWFDPERRSLHDRFLATRIVRRPK